MLRASKSDMDSRWLTCCRMPLFWGLSCDGSFYPGTRIRKTRGRGNDAGPGRLGFREKGGGRVDKGADQFGRGHGGRLQGLAMIEHPSGQHGFGSLLNPLIDECGYFLTQIRGVIEARQLVTLQRGARCRPEIIERRSKPRGGHGQSSNLKARPMGLATGITCAQY